MTEDQVDREVAFTSSLSILIFGLLVGVFAIGITAKAADDPSNGTWKMDPAKSKHDPGPAA